MLQPQAQVRSLKKQHLLVILVLSLSYQMQHQLKKVLFDLAAVRAHPNMKVVSNPRKYV